MEEDRDRATSARTLDGILRAQEVIRTVSASVRQVNLLALNAIVLTESSTVARGFARVANEMRTLSGQLEGEMDVLLSSTTGALRAAAQVLVASRRARILEACRRAAPKEAQRLDVDAPLRAARAAASEARARVRRSVNQMAKLGLMFTVVSRCARLEAAYGEGIADKLAAVSSDFANASNNISTALASIQEQQRELEE
jgi:hypothetical protein